MRRKENKSPEELLGSTSNHIKYLEKLKQDLKKYPKRKIRKPKK
jgi:hypothetical protein